MKPILQLLHFLAVHPKTVVLTIACAGILIFGAVIMCLGFIALVGGISSPSSSSDQQGGGADNGSNDR